jgi:hypothetical protein
MADADFLKGRERPLPVRPPRQAENHVSPDFLPWHQARSLEGNRTPDRNFNFTDYFAIKVGKNPQQRALSATTRAEERDELTGRNVEIKVL